MRSKLTITLRDGRSATTTGITRDDMLVMADFVAALGFKGPDVPWTISAATGPDLSASYGDISRVELTWEP